MQFLAIQTPLRMDDQIVRSRENGICKTVGRTGDRKKLEHCVASKRDAGRDVTPWIC